MDFDDPGVIVNTPIDIYLRIALTDYVSSAPSNAIKWVKYTVTLSICVVDRIETPTLTAQTYIIFSP